MNRRIHSIGVLAVIALSAVAMAAVDGFSVARKPKEGDTHKYRMTADVDLGGVPITVKGLLSEKVTKVETDGSFTQEETQIELKATVAGQETDIPSSGSSTMIYLPTGEVKSIAGDEGKAESYRMANLGIIYDPGKPLNVGDAWSFDIKANKDTGAVDAKADFKLLGEEKVGDVDTLKIKATVKETSGATPASSDGTVWISKADGSLIKSEAKWVNAPFPGAQGQLINATVHLEAADK
jgi:hypothetical protein